MPITRILTTFVLASLLFGCSNGQYDRLLGRDHRASLFVPSTPSQQPALENLCIATAIGNMVDMGVPPTLDLAQATIITASIAGTQICTEIANVNSNGQYFLSQLASVDGMTAVNITVKLKGTTTVFTRTYNPALSPSILSDIDLS